MVKIALKKSLSAFCVYAVFILTLLVLIGWQLQWHVLTRILPDAPATTPVTALLLMFISMSLALSDQKPTGIYKTVGMALAAFVFALAAWMLVKYWLNLPAGVEILLFRKVIEQEYNQFEGRPSPHTLFATLIISIVVFVSFIQTLWARRFLNVAGLLCWILPWLAFFGYFTSNSIFYEMPHSPDTGMSPITSFCFLLLCVGALALDQSQGLIYLLRSPSLGGKIIRMLLPLSLIGPLLFGWLINFGKATGFLKQTAFVTLDWGLASLIIIALVIVSGYLISDRDYKLFHIQMNYQRLVEDIQDYAIFMLDAHGNVITWNKGAEQIKGYEEEEIIGKHFSCFYMEKDQLHHKPEQLLQEALKSGRVEDSGWRVKKDGSQFWADVVITALYDLGGGFIGFVKVTRDLTVQKNYLEAIEDSRQRFRRFLESTPDAIVILNKTGQIVFSNIQAQTLFGYSSEELSALPADRLISELSGFFGDQIQPIKELLHRWSEREELYGHASDGREFPVEISLSTIDRAEETLLSVAIRDVTASRHAQKEIEALNKTLKIRAAEAMASNKELEAFSYSVSHDLRAPLRGIAGFSSKLIRNHSDQLDEEGKRVVSVIIQNVKRMGELIDDILMFSRLNRTHISYSTLNLNAMFQDAYQTNLAGEDPERNVEFTMEELPEVAGDRVTMMQVINNLVSNAVKYTRPREKATIHVGKLVNRYETTIFIRDNGVGFDDRYIDKIFEVFQRLHGEREFEGTGVGLAIVQRIIQRHGGKVWAESQVDHGATFFIRLPRAKLKNDE